MMHPRFEIPREAVTVTATPQPLTMWGTSRAIQFDGHPGSDPENAHRPLTVTVAVTALTGSC